MDLDTILPARDQWTGVIERLPKYTSGDYVEDLAHRLSERGMDLDITAFRRTRLFGEARLLGVLALCMRQAKPPTVRINADLPKFTPNNEHWKFFLESVAGFVTAQCAARILDRSLHDWTTEIRARQASVLADTNGLIGSGKEVAAPALEKYGAPPRSRLLSALDIDSFEASFHRLMFGHLGLDRHLGSEIGDVTDFAFETAQNTIDHGSYDMDGHLLEGGVRFVSLRRLNLPHEPIHQLVGTFPGPVSSYLLALEQELSSRYPKPRELIELTIADSGVGIPARMSGTETIYSTPITEERKYLLRALGPMGTSKLPTVTGAGAGLYKAMRATSLLRGLVVFRTGRLLMYKHYLGEKAPWPSLRLYQWNDSRQQLLAGTSISLLFPWMGPQQFAFDTSLDS